MIKYFEDNVKPVLFFDYSEMFDRSEYNYDNSKYRTLNQMSKTSIDGIMIKGLFDENEYFFLPVISKLQGTKPYMLIPYLFPDYVDGIFNVNHLENAFSQDTKLITNRFMNFIEIDDEVMKNEYGKHLLVYKIKNGYEKIFHETFTEFLNELKDELTKNIKHIIKENGEIAFFKNMLKNEKTLLKSNQLLYDKQDLSKHFTFENRSDLLEIDLQWKNTFFYNDDVFFEKNLINQILLSSPKILNAQNNFLFKQQILKDIFIKNYNLAGKYKDRKR